MGGGTEEDSDRRALAEAKQHVEVVAELEQSLLAMLRVAPGVPNEFEQSENWDFLEGENWERSASEGEDEDEGEDEKELERYRVFETEDNVVAVRSRSGRVELMVVLKRLFEDGTHGMVRVQRLVPVSGEDEGWRVSSAYQEERIESYKVLNGCMAKEKMSEGRRSVRTYHFGLGMSLEAAKRCQSQTLEQDKKAAPLRVADPNAKKPRWDAVVED